jgi:hypothetical protein
MKANQCFENDMSVPGVDLPAFGHGSASLGTPDISIGGRLFYDKFWFKVMTPLTRLSDLTYIFLTETWERDSPAVSFSTGAFWIAIVKTWAGFGFYLSASGGKHVLRPI